MDKSAIHRVCDLSPELRWAAEALLGQRVEEHETITVRAAKGKIVKKALTGKAREEAFGHLLDLVDKTAKRAEGTPVEEIDAAIEEAADYVRHRRA